MASEYVDSAEPEEHKYDYDLVVIGGGSGGLATSKEAAQLGKKVALLDFVVPSPHGSKWGLGGTCVNVGCIPKKLFHTAALLGEEIHDSAEYGWDLQVLNHDWSKLVNNVQDYIGSLNFGYRTLLRSEKVNYLNVYGRLVDAHTIECTNARKQVSTITSRRFLIATGGRPSQLEIPGGEHAIDSDDVFSLEKPPGKTLVVGASYVALECAGYLAGLGYDVTVMARSIFLRGFDQQMAELIGEYMQEHKTKFIRPAVPTKIDKLDSGKLKVTWNREGKEESDEFDTVLAAIGRKPETSKIGLDKVGVELDKAGKIITVNERTNIPNIYAIGDVISGGFELTPVAIRAGRLLARRLYSKSTRPMDYTYVPTTIFTPLEYGCCGYAEEDAIKKYGADNIEVYHSNMKPLEWNLPHREDNACYGKLICLKTEDERVIGFHVLGPHAGEITQGFAVAIKAGATKQDFDDTVGIHPTMAEDFTGFAITRRSGKSTKKTGC